MRHDDWRSRLDAYIAAAAREPFRPGRHDCALFAAGAVRAMTGDDPARGWRSKYRSLRRGRELLAEAGYDGPVDMAAARYPEIHPSAALPGDLAALTDDEGAPALGVVQGSRIYVLSLRGIATVPLTAAERAFRV